jgi:hypothetical protein
VFLSLTGLADHLARPPLRDQDQQRPTGIIAFVVVVVVVVVVVSRLSSVVTSTIRAHPKKKRGSGLSEGPK